MGGIDLVLWDGILERVTDQRQRGISEPGKFRAGLLNLGSIERFLGWGENYNLIFTTSRN